MDSAVSVRVRVRVVEASMTGLSETSKAHTIFDHAMIWKTTIGTNAL